MTTSRKQQTGLISIVMAIAQLFALSFPILFVVGCGKSDDREPLANDHRQPQSAAEPVIEKPKPAAEAKLEIGELSVEWASDPPRTSLLPWSVEDAVVEMARNIGGPQQRWFPKARVTVKNSGDADSKNVNVSVRFLKTRGVIAGEDSKIVSIPKGYSKGPIELVGETALEKDWPVEIIEMGKKNAPKNKMSWQYELLVNDAVVREGDIAAPSYIRDYFNRHP